MTLTADDLQRLITVVDAKATIEAGTATPVERIIAYASDTGEVGLWDGTTWTWVAGASSSSGSGEILISDTPAGSPLVFADLLQNEAEDDLLYGDL